MKQKKIVIALVFGIIVGIGAIGVWQQKSEISTQPTTVISQATRRASEKQASARTSQASVSGNRQATKGTAHKTVTSAPNQQNDTPAPNESRKVTVEHTYYPLATANDPTYSSNWTLQRVNAPAAWDISTGNNQTVVAVLDTGFALDHQDLSDRWYANNGEGGVTSASDDCWTGSPQEKSTNGCDDDDNGYNDDWRGWNFWLGDNNPTTGRTNPNGIGVAPLITLLIRLRFLM